MTELRLFFLLYIISVAFIYALQKKAGVPFLIPGDLYFHKGARKIYIPLGSSLILTIILFLILRRFIP